MILFITIAVLAGQFLLWPLGARYSPFLGVSLAEAALLIPLGLSLKLQGRSAGGMLLLRMPSSCTMTPALVAAASIAPLVSQLDHSWTTYLGHVSLWAPPSRQTWLEVDGLHHLSQTLGLLLSVVVFPAVCEELMFRGFVLTSLVDRYGRRLGVVGSALLFALSHLSLGQLPVLTIFGLVLAMLTLYTRSVLPAILAHLLNNALACLLPAVQACTASLALGSSVALRCLLVGVLLIVGARAFWQLRSCAGSLLWRKGERAECSMGGA